MGGLHDKDRMKFGKPKRYSIAKITKHPNWSENPYNGFPNDIAIIEVSGPMAIDGVFSKVIKMADEGESFPRQQRLPHLWLGQAGWKLVARNTQHSPVRYGRRLHQRNLSRQARQRHPRLPRVCRQEGQVWRLQR